MVKGGAGLAFISYPEAIAKFKLLPQAFAVLFFLMLLVLGMGSNIGMASCVITVIKDRFTHLPHWMLAISMAVVGFLCGLVYTTPGGQYILNLVDFFGCSFIALFLAIAELIAIGWIYGKWMRSLHKTQKKTCRLMIVYICWIFLFTTINPKILRK